MGVDQSHNCCSFLPATKGFGNRSEVHVSIALFQPLTLHPYSAHHRAFPGIFSGLAGEAVLTTFRDARALLVGGDTVRTAELADFLSEHCGWDSLRCDTPAQARALLGAAERIVLVVLGSAGPDAGAVQGIRLLRTMAAAAFILFIDPTATGELSAPAFMASADDVIRAPFGLQEFGARLRRGLGARYPADASALLPGLYLSAANHLRAVGVSGAVPLTSAEAEVVKVLMRHLGEIVTRDALSREIDKCEWVYGDRKFDVHITKIRKKLRLCFGERFQIKTVRAEGYILLQPGEADSSAG